MDTFRAEDIYLLDEINCQPQCVACNMFKSGEQFKFHINLDVKYGEGTSIKKQQEAIRIVKFDRSFYQEKISYYKSHVENLKNQKGIE